MCQFFSFIVTQDKTLYNLDNHRHTSILEKYNIKDENKTIGPLYEDIYHKLKKEIQSDERNIDFKYFYIESIKELPIK